MATWTSGIDEQWCEALDSSVDGHVVHFDPALNQEFFDISEGESVSEIPAHRERDHLGREPEPGERRTIDRLRLVPALIHYDTLAERRHDRSTQQPRRTRSCRTLSGLR